MHKSQDEACLDGGSNLTLGLRESAYLVATADDFDTQPHSPIQKVFSTNRKADFDARIFSKFHLHLLPTFSVGKQ